MSAESPTVEGLQQAPPLPSTQAPGGAPAAEPAPPAVEPAPVAAEPAPLAAEPVSPTVEPARPHADPNGDYFKFLAWKKNAQHLYETLLAFELPWPSPSVQWVPEVVTKQAQPTPKPGDGAAANSVRKQRLVLSTDTGGQAPEYLRIAELSLPDLSPPTSLVDYDAESGTIGGYLPAYAADLAIVQRILVQGSVTRARHMPQNPNIMATIASTGQAAIWDITKFPYNPVPHYVPTTSLAGSDDNGGHQNEGLCLSWSPTIEGQVASGDADGQILVWDLRRDYDSRTGSMSPAQRRHHAPKTAVNDLQWHPRRPATLASVGDDGYLIVHQTASDSAEPIVKQYFEGHKPTSVAWNPVNESLVAIGFDSGRIELWDLRNICTMISSLDAHAGYITALHWNTWHPSVFASASEDTSVKVWNAVDFGAPPLFTHGGHTAAVTDVAWNPADAGTLASVSEDNGLHVYRPGADLLGF